MKNVFEQEVKAELVERVNQLTAASQPKWGKMNAAQMFAHCSVAYKGAFEAHDKVNPIKRFLLKTFLKPLVVGEKAYPKNSRTAPEFLVTNERDFDRERTTLLNYIDRVFDEGQGSFEGRPSPSFGPLTAQEWSNLLYKHLNHHLVQFGV